MGPCIFLPGGIVESLSPPVLLQLSGDDAPAGQPVGLIETGRVPSAGAVRRTETGIHPPEVPAPAPVRPGAGGAPACPVLRRADSWTRCRRSQRRRGEGRRIDLQVTIGRPPEHRHGHPLDLIQVCRQERAAISESPEPQAKRDLRDRHRAALPRGCRSITGSFLDPSGARDPDGRRRLPGTASPAETERPTGPVP